MPSIPQGSNSSAIGCNTYISTMLGDTKKTNAIFVISVSENMVIDIYYVREQFTVVQCYSIRTHLSYSMYMS